MKSTKRVTAGIIFFILILNAILVNSSGTSSGRTVSAQYEETDVITFDNISSNGRYLSTNNNVAFVPKSSESGDLGAEVINDPNDTGNKIGVLKNIYDHEDNDDGTENVTSPVCSYMIVNDMGGETPYRINWRMKQLSNSKTEFHFESERSASAEKFEFLGYMGVSEEGLLLGPNKYSGENKIKNELAAQKISVNDNKWHNFEAYFYPCGKKTDNNRKLVELYCDGVLYGRYERRFLNSLVQIEIYSRGIENEAALYIDDIRLSRMSDDYYLTCDYNGEERSLEVISSDYPDMTMDVLASGLTFEGFDGYIESYEVSGRRIKFMLNNELEDGKRYIIRVPDSLTSKGRTPESCEIVIELPPDQPQIQIKTNKTGNVFTNSEPLSFSIVLKNTDSMVQTFTGKAWIEAEDGTVVWNTEKYNNLSASNVISGTEKTVILKPVLTDKTHSYGRFYLNIEVKPKYKQTYKQAKREFSVILSNGFVNDDVGICSHYSTARRNNSGEWSEDTYSVAELGNIEDVIDLQSLAGFGSARDVGFTYGLYRNGNVEPSEFMQKTYRAYNERGTNLIQLIGGTLWSKTGWYMTGGVYEGMHPMPISYTDSNGNVDNSELVDFKNKVKKFTEFNSQSHIYEIFNEWNLGTWNKKYDLYKRENGKDVLAAKDYTYTIKQYVEAVKAASEGIREGDPQAKIMGLSSAKDNMTEFIEECLKEGIAEYIDAVSIHPYSVSVAPEIGHKDDGKDRAVPLREKIESVKALLKKYNVDLPIVITEIGWTDAPFTPITEEIQAQYSIRALGLAGDLTESISLYEAVQHDNSDLYEQHYGMLDRNDGSDNALAAKPVFAAISCFNSLTADKKRTDGIYTDKDNGSVYCVYENECERVILYWNPENDNQALSVKMTGDEDDAYIRDINGNIISESVGTIADRYELTANKSPQYLIINKKTDSGLYITNAELKADGMRLTKRLADMKESTIIDLKTSFKNTGTSDAEVGAVVAKYDSDGVLTGVSIKNYTIKPNESLMPKDIPRVVKEDGETVKAFVLNMKSAEPLSVINIPDE